MSWDKLFANRVLFLFKKGEEPLCLPQEGRRIRITWLPSCRNVSTGTPNPYIGMEGIVEDLKDDGTFNLVGISAVLIITRPEYKFEYID